MWVDALNWTSAVCNVVGVLLTAIGIGQTWRQFRPQGARFWTPVTAPVGAAWGRVSGSARRGIAWARSKLRRRRGGRVQIAAAGLAVAVGTAAGIRAIKQFPEPSSDVERSRQELHDRVNEVWREVQNMRYDLTAEQASRERADAARDEHLTRELEQLRNMAQQVAISGLPLELTGVGLVVVGVVLQTLAQAIG